jgi:diacylglycerol kinase (ATP)
VNSSVVKLDDEHVRNAKTLRESGSCIECDISWQVDSYLMAVNMRTSGPKIHFRTMATTEPRGPRQILRAMKYSAQGLRAAWRHEASFRLEVYLLIPLLPTALWLGRSALERAALMMCVMMVPAMELMNGALEAIVDKTTPEHHVLAGRAKDMGSAAVFVCMMMVCVCWGLIAIDRFF